MTKTFLGTFALVFAAMLGLYGFDTLLAKMEQAESRAEAQRLFDQGQALLGQGNTTSAIEHFRSALSFSRKNPEYQLALARALLAGGKLDDAEHVSRDLLEQNPSDGAANLTMARLLAQKGGLADAEPYYHRAIYGRWPHGDAAKQRLQVRMELVDLLARRDDKQALLAELLALQDEKFDTGTRERIGRLYIQAGSPNRAAETYRNILREQPSNTSALAGLGAAEFARGDYRAAHVDFLAASRLQSNDPAIEKQLALSTEVLALDPTLRGLKHHERYERSQRLLAIAKESLSRCGKSPGIQPFIAAANSALKTRVRPAEETDVTDVDLELAEQLWQARRKQCREPVTDAEQPLSLVLTKISQ